MNTIQLGNITTYIDVSKYVKETVTEQTQVVEQEVNIQTEIPTKGTKQYDDLRTKLVNAKVAITDENLKTANLMIKNGIEVQKENIEAIASIKKQLTYVINHISEEDVKSVLNNELSLNKMTIDVLENIIKSNPQAGKKNVKDEELKEAIDKYIKDNDLKTKLDKKEIETISKCIEKLMIEQLPLTNKNVQTMVSAINKTEEIKAIDENITLSLIKKDKPISIENLYVAKYSSNKNSNKEKKLISDKDFNSLLPQIEKVIQKENIKDKNSAVKSAKLLLENELPVIGENISKIIDTNKFKKEGIDTDKLISKLAENIKQDKLPTDINLQDIIKEPIINQNQSNRVQKDKVESTSSKNQSNIKDSNYDYNTNQQKYQKILNDISKYNEKTINKVLDKGGEETLTLKNLQLAHEQIQQTSTQLKQPELNIKLNEQPKDIKTDVERELKVITAKRQLAEIRLRLTSEAMTTLLDKGIEVDTLQLKDTIKELKAIENDLYKSHLKMAGAETNNENIQEMKDLYEKLSDISELSAPTYKNILQKEIPFTIDSLSEAELENFKIEQQKLLKQQATKNYELAQTQPNPKFKENISKVAEQIEPLLESLNIEATQDNIRATKILVKNQMEVNEENILDIKLADSKVTKVTTQLHPNIVANMIREGLKPVQMNIDEVLGYMDNFKELIGEDLTEKLASYIYEMDKAGELTSYERESMIGIYRMLYTIDKTQGRATGFIVKNEMDLTLNNLMEASKYYDRTYAKYSDIDIKVDDNFGFLEKVIVDENNIKPQMERAYQEQKQINIPSQNEQTKVLKPQSNQPKVSELQDSQIIEQKINLINEFAKVKPETLAKLIKQEPNIEQQPLQNLLSSIEQIESKEPQNKSNEPSISQSNIEEILKFIDNNKALNEKDKQLILKLHNTLENIKSKEIVNELKDKPLTLDNLNNTVAKVKANIQAEEKNIEAKVNTLNEFIEKIKPETLTKLIKQEPNIEQQPLQNLLSSIEQIESKELQNKSNEPSVAQSNIEDILKFIDNNKTLNEKDKQLILKLHNTLENIKSKEIVNELKNKLLTLDNLNNTVAKVKANIQAEEKNIEAKVNTLNEFIEKIKPETLAKLIKQESNIEQQPLQNVLSSIKQIESKEPQNKNNEPSIAQSNMGDILKFINNNKTLNEKDKQLILKLHNTLENIKSKEVVNELKDSPLTLDNLNNTVAKIKTNIQAEEKNIEAKVNTLNEFIEKIKPETLVKLIKQKPNIEQQPLENVLSSIKQIESKEPQNKNNEPSIAQSNMGDILKFIDNNKALNEKDKQLILKLHNTLENIKPKEVVNELKDNPLTLDNLNNTIANIKANIQTEEKNIEAKVNTLNEFIEKIKPEILVRLIKQEPNIEQQSLENLLSSIKQIESKEPQNETNKPSVAQLNIEDILKFIDNNKTLNEKDKQLILKLHNTLENIKPKEVVNELKDKPLTLDNLNNTVAEIKSNIQVEEKNIEVKVNTLNEFIEKVKPQTLVKLIKQEPNIEQQPLENLLSSIKQIESKEPRNETNKPSIAQSNIDEVLKFIDNNKNLDENDKQLILKLHNTLENIKPREMINELKDQSFTLKNLNKVMSEFKINNPNELINTQNTINEFIQKLQPEIIPQVIKQFNDINNTPVENILEYINKTPNLENINVTNELTKQEKEIIKETTDIINLLKEVDNSTIHKINPKELTLSSIINSIGIDKEQYEQFTQQQIKAIEYDKNIIEKFIQKAQPEIISKLIKQYPNIENIPIETILKSMEEIKVELKSIENKIPEQAKEFIENLNKINNVEPTTILWMQKHEMPLTIDNIQIMQNFIKDSFWLGKELNKLSKDVKEKFENDKLLNKVVSKKDLSALKQGKSVTEILDDLNKEIEEIKKESIKLPEQERQSFWKQSSTIEKAIELQKQIQKDETIYQIPIELHNGLTNMNLYVMNDKEGNGKLSKDDMRVFIAMETETMGTLQIYMKLSEKNVSFQINSDNAEATKFLKAQQTALEQSIESIGFMVGKMQYGEEEKKSPLKSQIQSQTKPIGKNIAKDGFEMVI